MKSLLARTLLASTAVVGTAQADDETAAPAPPRESNFGDLAGYDHPVRLPVAAPKPRRYYQMVNGRLVEVPPEMRQALGRNAANAWRHAAQKQAIDAAEQRARIKEARRQLDAAAGNPFPGEFGLRPAAGPLRPALR